MFFVFTSMVMPKACQIVLTDILARQLWAHGVATQVHLRKIIAIIFEIMAII